MSIVKNPKTPVTFRLIIKKGENTEMQIATDDAQIILSHLEAWITQETKGR